MLEKARIYEKEKLETINFDNKPKFHMSSPIGWINDPNGFSEYDGEKHLFFQYNPFSTDWGPMHWGHCKTRDFVKWEYVPAALAPDTDADKSGCFSGSAIENDGKHILMYTGVREAKDGEKLESYQEQCIAIGDGLNYQKLEQNPVITYDMLPKDSIVADFRDPKIWLEGNTYYCVIGSRNEDGSGQIVLFKSRQLDLSSWEFCKIIDKSNNEYGKMWECPDLFSLDGKQILIVSPQEMEAEGYEFHPGNNTLCIIGDNNGVESEFVRTSAHAIDYGMDFYAPQTMGTSDGRRIMIAWMKSWENDVFPDDFEWNGMMTFPRELHVRNERLYQNPVEEIEQYYDVSTEVKETLENEKKSFNGIHGRVADLTLEISNILCSKFKINVAENDKYVSYIEYNPAEGLIEFNRSYSGIRKDCVNSRTIKVKQQNNKIKIRLLLDSYSVEAFINDGEQAFSFLIFTDQDAKGISFEAIEGSADILVDHNTLKFSD